MRSRDSNCGDATSADVKLYNAFVQCLPSLISASIDRLMLSCSTDALLGDLTALLPREDRKLSPTRLIDYAVHLNHFREEHRAAFEKGFLRRAELARNPTQSSTASEFRTTQRAWLEAPTKVDDAWDFKVIDRLESLCQWEFHNLLALQISYRDLNRHSLPNVINAVILGTSLADSFLRTPFKHAYAQSGLLYFIVFFANEVRKQIELLSKNFSHEINLEEFAFLQNAPQFQPFLPTIPIDFGG